MRYAMLLAATVAMAGLGAGAAQAQLVGGQALRSSTPTTAARAGLGVQVNPGGHITPRIGTREWNELHGNVRADVRGYSYAAPYPAPYDARYDARYAPNYAPNGYYAPQPTYAAGSYVWVDNRGWVWVPQGAYVRADGSVGAAVSSDFRSNLGGRVGGGIR